MTTSPATSTRGDDGDGAAEPPSPDMLVVGAGPVGVTLGILLAEHGIPTLVIDKRATPPGCSSMTFARQAPGRGAEPMQVAAVGLTAQELEALDAAAAGKDMSRSEAIRAALANFAGQASCRVVGRAMRDAVDAHRGSIP